MSRITRPVIIDVEASGFGSDSYPIEVGVVLTSGKRYCSLIFPASEWTHWDAEAAKVHGITKAFLKKYGRPVTEVAKALNSLLADQTVYTDAWAVDLRWITRLFYTAGIYQQFKVSALENILSEAQMNIWHETKNQVLTGVRLKRHRASSDAFIIQETYARTLNQGAD
ncbi:MAG: hypothetical protein HF978_13915 [Desulfobacteraceae bacterium]|nr:hypothetical protein [Desulfobacteraceae bacterium]MBC2756635.1 hypothetical protein [Desulfobacteraceae bacterium]